MAKRGKCVWVESRSIEEAVMKLKHTVIVLFLAVIITGFANAEPNSRFAGPQSFQVFDDYVIAVGTRDRREPVEAPDIIAALRGGKEIWLAYVEVPWLLKFSGSVKKDVYSIDTKFSGGASGRPLGWYLLALFLVMFGNKYEDLLPKHFITPLAGPVCKDIG